MKIPKCQTNMYVSKPGRADSNILDGKIVHSTAKIINKLHISVKYEKTDFLHINVIYIKCL